MTPIYSAILSKKINCMKVLLYHDVDITTVSGNSRDIPDLDLYLKNKNITRIWKDKYNIDANVRLFILSVGQCDDYFTLKDEEILNVKTERFRFFKIMSFLPQEIQTMICNYSYDIYKLHISTLEVNRNIRILNDYE